MGHRYVGVKGAPPKEWLKEPANCASLIECIPSINVGLELRLARDRDPKHPADKNDLKDLIFLSLAIPYANFVITDKAWAQVTSTTNLAKKYETVIYKRVSQLVAALDAMPD